MFTIVTIRNLRKTRLKELHVRNPPPPPSDDAQQH